MVLEQKPARKQGAPNRCCHRTIPTASASSLTTTAWWPMPDCSFLPPSPSTWACGNSSTITLTSAARRGRANTGDKMLTLVASALAGGDCIDDADALRAGGTVSVLGCMVKAPSTLGTFLRSFRWGHVRQLDRVSRQLLAPGMGRWGRTRRLAPDHRPGLDHLRDLWTGQGGSAPPRLHRRARVSPAAGHCRRHRRGADVPSARGPGQHRPRRRPLPP